MDPAYRITHYQTSFILDACPVEESERFIFATLWDWLLHKKERLPADVTLPEAYQAFLNGTIDQTFNLPENRLRTVRCELPDRLLWGMEYFEQPDRRDSLRQTGGDWLTEVGVTVLRAPAEGKPRVIFCARASVEPWTAFFDTPTPTVPRFVKALIDTVADKRALQARGGDNLFHFSVRPRKITRGEADGEAFARFLLDPARHYPVVVAASLELDESDGLGVLLRTLGRKLLGKGLVFWIKSDSKAYRRANATLPEPLRLKPNTLYVVRPVAAPNATPIAEDYGILDPASLHERLLAHLYRYQPVLEEGAVTPTDIRRARRHELERLIAEHRHDEQIAQWKKEYETLKDENADWVNACDEAEAEARAYKAKYDECRRLNEALQARLDAAANKDGEARAREVAGLLAAMAQTKRGSLPDQVRVCEPLFADRIVLTRKAYDAIEADGKKDLTFAMTMDFLIALYFRLYPTYCDDQPVGDRREAILSGTGIECSKETASTLTNKDYARMRNVRHNGRDYLCEEHLKMKKGDTRLYYAFSKSEKKFIVCHIGAHLPTMATRKLGLPRNQ